jgi:isopenicillin N synthase-like dioxygenase
MSIERVNISPFVSKTCSCEHTFCHCKEDVVEKLLKSISSLGFVFIEGHEIPEALQTNVFQQLQTVFHQNFDEKKIFLSKDRARRGYSPVESENFASLVGEKRPNDLVEKIRFGPELDSAQLQDPYYSSKEGRIHFVRNEWGNDDNVQFRSVILQYYEHMERVAHTILEILALSLETRADSFTASMTRHTSILTANGYPPISRICGAVGDYQLRVAEHTDVSLITIVNQYQCGVIDEHGNAIAGGGLEILTRDGFWLPVPYLTGESQLPLPPPHSLPSPVI